MKETKQIQEVRESIKYSINMNNKKIDEYIKSIQNESLTQLTKDSWSLKDISLQCIEALIQRIRNIQQDTKEMEAELRILSWVSEE